MRVKRENARFFLRILLIIILTIGSTGSLFGDVGEDEKVASIPDPNLEIAIREEIGKPTGDIYQSDLTHSLGKRDN